MKSIQLLAKFCNRPMQSTTKTDWSLIEKSLGIELPNDFKQLADTFGVGGVGWRDTDPSFIIPSSPHLPKSAPAFARFPESVLSVANSFRELRDEFPEEYPYAFYPEKNGLINWAHDSNGNYYFWEPKGEPDEWPIVILKRNGDRLGYAGGCVGFLCDVALGEFIVAQGIQPNSIPQQILWTAVPIESQEKL